MFDISQFPFVWMSLADEPGHNHDEDFAEFARAFERRENFVLLSEQSVDDDHAHTQEDKKRTSLWMKKHKTQLRTYVKAMIQIEPNGTKRLAMKAFAIMFSKFWGFPLMVVSTKDEALKLATELLAKRDTTTIAAE